ncbi:restriction endonuclease subunit S [Acidithiobacillus sp.]|uniref:restriction endonuclease subunit S n=1 Tax=Acidithiobacillus sp. TaxID=1872118 RepID=UPI00261CD733|nr:restriction endonuclease subunit S [Acidithiobacillus sp.]MDD2748760.1 restriction endonuclease subunit S [Acidithiobacillus sp.]MDD5280535.1 restriction endonuclease subunit S [Acidithiobacillus sp.]
MSGTTKSVRVPRLRFPEFRDVWISSPVSGLFTFKGNNSLSRDKLNYTDGPFKNIHYGDIHTKFSQHFRADVEQVPYVNKGESHSTIRPENYCMNGDVIFADASEDMADIGKAIEIIDVGDVPLVSGLHTIFARPTKGSFAIGFVAYLFSSEGVRKQIQREAQGAKVLGLSATRLGGVLLLYPRSPTEQQKIADCLSSLDDLITLEAQKLDSLKAHKKGLMQQLFPREGKTQPRLRFPEFRNAGEWEVKPLGEIFPITSSKRVHESDWTVTGVPFYRAREIVALSKHEMIQPLFISEELYSAHSKQTGEIRDGHLLVTGVGSIGVPYLVRAGDRFYFKDGNIIWLKNDGKELSGEFLLRLYETDYVQNQIKAMADVGTVATYTIDNAKRTLAAFPRAKAEQQRIASCLTSLDDLITAQTQKLEALKTHKKGLMQQLFPQVSEE